MIPGVETFHPRESWQDPRWPISGPLALWDRIREGVAHYPGVDEVPDGDIHEHADHVPAFLRSAQRSWAVHRGYSLGYMFAVDWLGGVWEIRGFTFRSAANPGSRYNPTKLPHKNANLWTAPVLFIVDPDKRLTPEAAAAGRAVWSECARRAATTWLPRPRPHSFWDPTACPSGVQADIDAGLLDTTYQPDPTEEDPPMPPYLIEEHRMRAVFLPDGTPVSEQVLEHLTRQGVPVISQDHQHWRETMYHRVGPTAAELYRSRFK